MYAIAATMFTQEPDSVLRQAEPATEVRDGLSRLLRVARQSAEIVVDEDAPLGELQQAARDVAAQLVETSEQLSALCSERPAAAFSAPADDLEWWSDAPLSHARPIEVGEALESVAFACSLQIASARRALGTASDGAELYAAIERAQRKLRRAAHALVSAARVEERGAGDVEGLVRPELESGLAVRRLYGTVRRELRVPSDTSADAVLVAARYVAGALASLASDPAYRYARASDRSLIAGLRERLIQWARSARAADAGLDLLNDIAATAELLREINRRQELVAHDREVLFALRTASGERIWTLLGRLEGMDDVLDRLTLVGPRDDNRVDEIRARLDELA